MLILNKNASQHKRMAYRQWIKTVHFYRSIDKTYTYKQVQHQKYLVTKAFNKFNKFVQKKIRKKQQLLKCIIKSKTRKVQFAYSKWLKMSILARMKETALSQFQSRRRKGKLGSSFQIWKSQYRKLVQNRKDHTRMLAVCIFTLVEKKKRTTIGTPRTREKINKDKSM